MLLERMIRAARLDAGLYEEVERDRSATGQAFMVVLLVSLASGLGSALGFFPARPGTGAMVFFLSILAGILGWVVWAYVVYFIGTRVFSATATPEELLRTLGFASVPRLLNVLSFIPCIGGLVSLAVLVWSLITGFIAIRAALDLNSGNTLITLVLGWLAMAVITMLLSPLGLASLIRL